MKKSELFKLAQVAVVESNHMAAHIKLEVLRVLMAQEEIHKTCEKHEETKESEEK